MTVPAIVEERLDGEAVTARVPLGGDDELFVTPARTLIYRAEGLLSGQSVEDYPHEAERLTVGEGRRKCTISLDHGLDGESKFSVPADRFEDAIEPILHGVLTTAGIIDPDEDVTEVYRLGELTLVITDARVVKHVGAALWDEEYEEYPFELVTAIDVEEGSVSSQVIVEVDRRPQRIKTPTDDARRIRERVEAGVLDYHGVSSYDEFLRAVQAELEAEDEESGEAETEADPAPESEDPEQPAEPEEAAEEEPAEATAENGGESSGMIFGEGVGTEPIGDSGDADELADELASLRAAVERQNDLLRRHQQAIERLTREIKSDD